MSKTTIDIYAYASNVDLDDIADMLLKFQGKVDDLEDKISELEQTIAERDEEIQQLREENVQMRMGEGTNGIFLD